MTTESELHRLFWLTGICIYGLSSGEKVVVRHEFMAAKPEKTLRLRVVSEAISLWKAREADPIQKGRAHLVRTANGLCFLCGKCAAGPEGIQVVAVGPFLCENGFAEKEGFKAPFEWPERQLRVLALPALHTVSQAVWPNTLLDTDEIQRNNKPDKITSVQLDVAETNIIEYNNYHEFRLLYLVAHGMSDQLAAYMETMGPLELPGHIKDYGLRTKKNITIIQNSLATRAAISGGLPPLYARSICAYYHDLIERAPDDRELDTLRKKCAQNFCDKLREYQQQTYSTLVCKALSCLQVGLANAPTLGAIAAELNVSCEHLSRTIKKETGKTFTQLLTQARVDEACFYLSCTRMPVWEIASLVGCASSTAFCQMFKRATKVTPQHWRTERNFGRISPFLNEFEFMDG